MRGSQAKIHLYHFRNNIHAMRAHVGAGTKLCLAVKADAYGHGAVEISREAIKSGVDFLAVATADEGVELRTAGIQIPILLLIPPPTDKIPLVLAHFISSVVTEKRHVDGFHTVAENSSTQALLHLKIDTGMGRIGCHPGEVGEIAASISESKFVKLEGTCTHFAVADDRSSVFTAGQIKLFNRCLAEMRESGIDPGIVHAANSAALQYFPDAKYDMVRPGILSYGYAPSDTSERLIPVRPVMELCARIIQIKKVPKGTPLSYGLTYKTSQETNIATVAVGYADGYSRLLSNRGSVAINSQRYPVVGTVCMDQILVDIGLHSRVDINDSVVLFGPGERASDAAQIAEIIGTIPYEVTCGINSRVPRLYLNHDPSRARGISDLV